MTKEQVQHLFRSRSFPFPPGNDELIETHISWVILSGDYAYKIKKPIRYSFLNFSTLEKRRFFCRRELLLNNRLTSGIYLDVLPVREGRKGLAVGAAEGKIVDYLLFMRRMDGRRRMDLLLRKGEVTRNHMRQIARQVAAFHREALPVSGAEQAPELNEKFADILLVVDFIERELGKEKATFLKEAVEEVSRFLERHKVLLLRRSQAGRVIDGHGDLHSRNIMLLEEPVIFDCIEFNDGFRHVDVLNEVAFFCMDLDFFGQERLADAFLCDYLSRIDAAEEERDMQLFQYYKLYRANVRLKVNCLRALQPDHRFVPAQLHIAVHQYFELFRCYCEQLFEERFQLKEKV